MGNFLAFDQCSELLYPQHLRGILQQAYFILFKTVNKWPFMLTAAFEKVKPLQVVVIGQVKTNPSF